MDLHYSTQENLDDYHDGDNVASEILVLDMALGQQQALELLHVWCMEYQWDDDDELELELEQALVVVLEPEIIKWNYLLYY